jgi:RHH-type proline utilization regulon transcriptional repressor/proline dehydrogenase/delta 1-pyrroline-5-carboxylate dehydrogenase
MVTLPGPTGERNSLHFAARGRVGCLALTLEGLLQQLVAVFATGNSAVLLDGALTAALPATLAGFFVAKGGDVASADVTAVLYEGDAADRLRQTLAQRDGALIPLLTADEDGYNLHRLVVERAVSVNTTAAGGNASLMSIGD